MIRFLLIILVGAMVVAVLNRLRFRGKNYVGQTEKLSSIRMVKCNYCQLHISQEDSLTRKGQYYCCIEHQEKAEIENCQ